MPHPDNIQWPYGFKNGSRKREPVRQGHLNGMGHRPEPPVANFVASIADMTLDEQREFFTWLRQMMDYCGYDSATALEVGIDQE